MNAINAQPLVIQDRYKLLPDQPLPQFDTQFAKAYVVVDLRNTLGPLYCLVCAPWPLPQIEIFKNLQQLNNLNIMQVPLAYEFLEWPGNQGNRVVIVFPQLSGGRFIQPGARKWLKVEADEIENFLIKPAISMLEQLNHIKILYRNFRLDNLYFLNAEKQILIFGENISTPPGYCQPTLFEPIERALCPPEGRGVGSLSDDLFALGVMTFCLLSGQYPHVSEKADFMEKRLHHGTYRTLMGYSSRWPTRIVDFLQGVLVDSSVDRWQLNDVIAWLAHHKVTVKPSDDIVSSRPFMIEDQECYTTRMLVQALVKNWGTSYKYLVKQDALVTWVRRCLHNDELSDKVTSLLEYIQLVPPANMVERERVLGQICVLLDTRGPIRWKENTFMPDSFHTVTAQAYYEQKNVPMIREMLRARLLSYWMQQNYAVRHLIKINPLYESFSLPTQEDQQEEAIYRLMYKLNPGLSCLAEGVRGLCLATPALLVKTLEHQGVILGLEKILDLHILAFLVAHLGDAKPYPLFTRLPAGQPAAYLEKVQVFADIQRLYNLGPLPKLTQMFLDGAHETVWATYKNQQTREQQQKVAKSVAAHGDISALLYQISNPGVMSTDSVDFKLSQDLYQELGKKITTLNKNYLDNERELNRRSHSATTSFTMILGAVTLVASVLYMLKVL